ncbi:transporter [bacterium]|nr:transporter [bacterium]RIK73378.1 MAG: hypothetical protein DCC62_17415 [candidate division KSB1 bacterium]
MMRRFLCVICLVGLGFGMVQAQDKAEDVNLFQTFFQDATITKTPFGEGLFQFSDYDNASSIDLAVQAGLPITPQFQLSGGLGFRNISIDVPAGVNIDNSSSGITDMLISGRYNVVQGPTPITIGGLITLPIGSEDIGESSFDFSGFGSLRHALQGGVVLTSTVALEFIETGPNRDTSLLLAGGVIYPTQNNLNLIGELNIRTEGDYILLSGGVDYLLSSGGRLRGGLGLGLDDGAPNFQLRAGYLLGF